MSDLRSRALAALLSALALVASAGVAVVTASPASAQIVLLGHWREVAAGGTHTCAIKLNGTLWCWGANSVGQLGTGPSTPSQNAPVQVGIGSSWKSVTTGDSHTCALTAAGDRYCWGDNIFGRTGLGLSAFSTFTPTTVSGEGAWTSLDAGYDYTCGIKANGRPYCWGRNHHGQLGVGDTTHRNLPVQVSTNLWQSVSAGGLHTCGIRGDGLRFCWGGNGSGQLGLGDFSNRTTPIRLLSETSWDTVVAGEHHTCGIQGVLLFCWGNNLFGQLGVGDNTGRNLPTVNGVGFTSVAPGGFHTCRLANASRSCTGAGGLGALGLGSYNDRNSFGAYRADQSWQVLSTSGSHTCGVTTSNRLYCWGDNNSGQLGIGTTTPTVNVPSQVS